MYIVVAPPEAPTVREPEDLKRLSVVASSRLELAEVTASLRAVGACARFRRAGASHYRREHVARARE